MKLHYFDAVLLFIFSTAFAQNCLLPEKTVIEGTISELLQNLDGSNTNPVTISSFQYTCQVQGDRRDTYRQLSVIATFTNSVTGTRTRHFQLQCQGNQWDPNLGEGLQTPPNNFQSLSTRTDCRQCTNGFNDDHHCRPCSPTCPGSGRCPAVNQCCSYFATDGTCTNNCTLSDGINYISGTASTNFTCSKLLFILALTFIYLIACNLTCLPGETRSTDCAMCNVTDVCLRYTPCQNGATCTNEGTNDYTCECVAGFTDKNCSSIDDCSPNPCLNGGICIDGINDYTCECVAGYTGKNCSTNIDECNPNPCLNGGTCTDGINDYTCECVAGFTDKNCSTNIDECSPNPCLNGGTCTDDINDYTCECVAGFTDKNCTTNIDDCSPNPCLNGGTCIDGINDYTCECVAGFTDKNCTTNIDDCSPNPCLNGGTCIDGINDYTCECVAGFTDKNCSTNIDECSPNPCLNEGTCTDGINNYTCECVVGFTGKSCSTNINGCNSRETTSCIGMLYKKCNSVNNVIKSYSYLY